MVYAVNGRGHDALSDRGLIESNGARAERNRELRDRYVAHQAMVADFRIALILATRASPTVRLLAFVREGDSIRDSVTADVDGRLRSLPVNPDGFFGLWFTHLPDGANRAFFFVEADRSTMTRERFVQKLRAYWAWHREGGHTRKLSIRSFRVLTVTKSDERAANLIHATRACSDVSDALHHFWFTTQRHFAGSDNAAILGRIWETALEPGVRMAISAGR
jgi:hypothetical protein